MVRNFSLNQPPLPATRYARVDCPHSQAVVFSQLVLNAVFLVVCYNLMGLRNILQARKAT